MDPAIPPIWNGAINGLKKAKNHLRVGEAEIAKAKALNAATSGLIAITLLLRGREDDRHAREVALDEGFFDDWKRTCSRPQDYIMKAEKYLKHFSDLSPPENKLLFG